MSRTKTFVNPARIAIAVLLVGALFQLQRWPGGEILMLTAYVGLAGWYVVLFARNTERNLLDALRMLIVVVWCLSGIVSQLHLPQSRVARIVSHACLAAWLLLEGGLFITPGKPAPEDTPLDHFPDTAETESQVKKRRMSWLLNLLLAVSATMAISGYLFRIMHWPGYNFLIVGGLAVGVVWYIVGFLRR